MKLYCIFIPRAMQRKHLLLLFPVEPKVLTCFLNEKVTFLHRSKLFFAFVYVFVFVQLVCVTKYKNCLCGFVYPSGDKKLRSIVVLYFFLLYRSQPVQRVFTIDILENIKLF